MNNSPTKELNNTIIILMIDGRFIHGGLTDRLRGIISIYHYCKEKGIKFYLNYIYPFNLSLFLEPNEYNWEIDTKDITYNKKYAEPIVINDWQLDVRLHKMYLDKVVSKHKGKQIHIYSNSPFLNNNFRQDFKELFHPSFKLQNKLDEILTSIGESYIAMVFRFQQLLGDFKEAGYKILSKKEQKELIQQCIKKTYELYNKHHPNEIILITSDSTTFLKSISSELDFVRTIPGKVVHMDYTSDATNDVYMKSFVDLFILSKAKKIYLLQTGEMYHSGFAKQAAMIKNAPYEEIIF